MIGAALRWGRTLGGLLGAAMLCAPVSAGSFRAPADAPSSWIAYAGVTTRAVTARLQGQDEAAVRLRAYLDATRPTPDAATPPILLKLWIDPAGVVTRIEVPPFAHAQPGEDMRTLILGLHIAGKPPKGMIQPLRIMVQLDPAPVLDRTD